MFSRYNYKRISNEKIILPSALALFLSACGDPTVEDLLEDPAKLSEISQKCQMLMAQDKDTNTEECKNAKKAGEQMAKNLMKGMTKDAMNGAFGK